MKTKQTKVPHLFKIRKENKILRYDKDGKPYYIYFSENAINKINELWKKNKQPELKTYTYKFECPNIDELKTEEDKEYLYNKVIEEFQYKLKELIN